jgi:hypothetical protein
MQIEPRGARDVDFADVDGPRRSRIGGRGLSERLISGGK